VQPERDVRVKRAQRGQLTWGRVDLDAEVPADHEVRAIAAVVDQLDLRELWSCVSDMGSDCPGSVDRGRGSCVSRSHIIAWDHAPGVS
jgi:hypothetical protein